MERIGQRELRNTRIRFVFAFFVFAELLVAFFPLFSIMGSGGAVPADSREVASVQHDPGTPVLMVVSDPCWGNVWLNEHSDIFEIIRFLRKTPPASGPFPGESRDKLEGYLSFADGTVKPFSLTSVFRLDDEVYYSEDSAEELQSIRALLESRVFSIPRLSAFFTEDNQILLSGDSASLTLGAQEQELIRSALYEAEAVEDRAEAAQTVVNRAPRYTVTVRDSRGMELIRLLVYSNESTLVYDVYSGRGNVLCVSSELDTVCKRLLDSIASGGI